MESAIEQNFSNIMDPQKSSYKCYLDIQKLALQVKNENCPYTTKIIKGEKFDVFKVVDVKTKEEESFLFNCIGHFGSYVCLKIALNNFFSEGAHQTVLVFMDILNDDFDKKLNNVFLEQTKIHKIENLKVSAVEIACDTYTDFVSGRQTSLNEAEFTYFDCEIGKFREILELFKTRQKNGWQAYIIRINHTTNNNVQTICNIILLNPQLSTDNEGGDIVSVNRSLTAILNCHYEPQIYCDFTKFINTLTSATNVSAIITYPSEELNFMEVKTILFHSCFKYVHSSDPGETTHCQPVKKTDEYIKRLRSKISKIEKETRAKVVKELSDFYFQQYSVLRDNYVKALSQMENSKFALDNMENATFQFNHAVAIQNFTELGDCSSKIKGLVYLMYETQRQFKCLMKMNERLLKAEKAFEKRLEDRNESFDMLRMENNKLVLENEHLTHLIEVKDLEMTEQKHKTYKVVKHYQRAIKFYQTSRVTDQDVIKANRKEIHSLLRYINQIRRKESVRTSEKPSVPFSRMIQLKYFRKSQSPSAIKTCIKERVNYGEGDDETKLSNDMPFIRVRTQM